MTDSGRSTSDRCGSGGCMRRRGESWIISAVLLAEQVGITRESVTNQLITKCHLSAELFTPSKPTESWNESEEPPLQFPHSQLPYAAGGPGPAPKSWPDQ